MDQYPQVTVTTVDDVKSYLERIVELRDDDITAFNNLPQIFIGGRKVERIPASSTDILPQDSVGDFNYNQDYLYILVNIPVNSAGWRRVALATW